MVEIIAEIGQNHCGSMWLAKKLIEEAWINDADVAKFQIYDTDKIMAKDFEWYKTTKNAELTKDNVIELMDYCDTIGIEFLSSVFNADRVQWTEELGMKRYKIAARNNYSNDNCERELIDAISKTGKDIIFSLGWWTDKNLPSITTAGKVDFLYCISKYPTMPEDIDWDAFRLGLNNVHSGFSDHTIGIEAAQKAIDLGAKIVEKHFTMDKRLYGPDHKGSMDPKELRALTDYAHKQK